MVLRVAITDIVELELAIKANKPASESEEKFGKRRVDVEVILSEDVIGSKFTKMNFVESVVGEKAQHGHVFILTRLGLDGSTCRSEAQKPAK